MTLEQITKKRSVSIPPDLDAQIEAAAAEAGMTYSAWLAATARKATPPLFETLAVLGRDLVRRRLRLCGEFMKRQK